MKKPVRLGDILIRKKQLAPHQLGVALEVQRRARLPLGRILVGTRIISRPQLVAALLHQKVIRLLGKSLRRPGLYGLDLPLHGQDMLEAHLKKSPAPQIKNTREDSEVLKIRRELASLPVDRAARIIENDAALSNRLLNGNF